MLLCRVGHKQGVCKQLAGGRWVSTRAKREYSVKVQVRQWRLPMYALSRLPRFAWGAALVASALAISAPISAEWLDYPTPGIPRMKNGKPDLSAPTPKDASGKPD